MENALLNAAQEWRTTFDSITDRISILNKEHKITRVNRSFSNAFGMEPKEILGKTCYEMMHETKKPLVNCPHVKTLKTNKPQRIEYFDKKHNSYFEVSTSPVFNKKGKVLASVHISKDITQSKKAERELKKAKEAAETANQTKSEFLANMSHELRTPLNSVIGFSEVLEDETFGGLNEKQKDYLGDILGSAKHLLSLINDILDLSKIEAGKMELFLSTFSLRELLENSFILIKERAMKHNIELSTDIEDNVELITADQRKVKQVIFNLLSNAIKFTSEGGQIGIRAKKTNGYFTVNVWDTGIGIPEKYQAHIFDDFTQLENPYTKTQQGTGLGLPLSRKFIQLHGGELQVEPSDKGSTFILTLPINQKNKGIN